MMYLVMAASLKERIIGYKGQLPWHNKADLKNFQRLTLGAVCIMGSRTYQSLKKPLPNRVNVVLSSRSLNVPKGVYVFHSYEEAVDTFYPSPTISTTSPNFTRNIAIIGGSTVVKRALQDRRLHIAYISFLPYSGPGDSFLPPFDKAWYPLWQSSKKDLHTCGFIKTTWYKP